MELQQENRKFIVIAIFYEFNEKTFFCKIFVQHVWELKRRIADKCLLKHSILFATNFVQCNANRSLRDVLANFVS